jgi:hypothetical protein
MREIKAYQRDNRVYTMNEEGKILTFVVMFNGDLLLDEKVAIPKPPEKAPDPGTSFREGGPDGRWVHLSEEERETITALRAGTAAVVPRAVVEGIQIPAKPPMDEDRRVYTAMLMRVMKRSLGTSWMMRVDQVQEWLNGYALTIERNDNTDYVELRLHTID